MTASCNDREAVAAAIQEPRNTVCIEGYQVLVRVGWIFKTETIIMPAVLDAVVDSGLLRGLLPVLNRGGQSLPPLVVAGWLGRQAVKKWALVGTTLAMAACFAALAAIWTPLKRSRPDLLAAGFLVLYAAFSASNGLTQLVASSLQGTLIPAGRRGRALVVSTVVGSCLAIVAAWLLLGPWLAEPDGFPKIFAATAVFFACAAVVPAFISEPAEEAGHVTAAARVVGEGAGRSHAEGDRSGRSWWQTLAADPALVRLSLVAACFAAVLILFPHYQAFARDALGSRTASLLTWVIVQNVATGVASIVAGPVSDRRGTKIVLAWLILLSASTPLVVTSLSLLPHGMAVDWFWIVYAPLGLNPIALRFFTLHALELAPATADQPRYVSIVGAALAVPFVLSPAVGWAVDAVGFRPVFVAGAAVIALGAVTAFGLPEPRQRPASPRAAA
jgi:hypothetical protein